MKLTFFGAARDVTGSCIHLYHDGIEILIDCGMHQGIKAEKLNNTPFSFNPAKISYLILTHAHLDHSGLIPKLVKEGFKGRIFTTPATRDLAEILLYDSAHIQEKDAEWLTRKNLRKGRTTVVEPVYKVEDVLASLPYFENVPYGLIRSLDKGIRFRLIDAGHILGSASVELWFKDETTRKEKKIVFSGDIGKSGNPLIEDPTNIEKADYICIESTYGDRFHKNLSDTVEELREAVSETLRKEGNVLIPAFSVGRTQDVLFVLHNLAKENKLKNLNIFVDSPLAEKATQVYLSHVEMLEKNVDLAFLYKNSENYRIHFTKSVEESQRLNAIKSGAIIIAGSGMCEGGRIRHHMKHNIWRPECSVIFTGFQAKGTLGRLIVDGAKKAKILGEEIVIRSKIFTIGGFSAHADQKELLEWLGKVKTDPMVFINHGEEKASLEFEKKVVETLRMVTKVPSLGDSYEL
ncbi:MAG: MBL fold metallo-hydrolase [Deltaproteobacteria bacterium]|nr:MBL fold metallo-hydrolase [Deltaproteobacteria bacterium]